MVLCYDKDPAVMIDSVRLDVNHLSADPTKWPNTLKQFAGKLPTNCLSVFGHFVNLALKGLRNDAFKGAAKL